MISERTQNHRRRAAATLRLRNQSPTNRKMVCNGYAHYQEIVEENLGMPVLWVQRSTAWEILFPTAVISLTSVPEDVTWRCHLPSIRKAV